MNTTASQSLGLSVRQVANLIDAADYAWRSDRKLSRALTFNLESVRDTLRPQEFVIAFTKLAGDWLRTRHAERAYLWVLESPPGRSLNLHLLFHVPDELMAEFAKHERAWTRQAGVKWRKGVLQSQKVGVRSGQKNRSIEGGEYLVNLEQTLGYLLKGSDEQVCHFLGVDRKHQGVVYGKRAGVSESIGPKARHLANYQPPLSPRQSLLFRNRCYIQARETIADSLTYLGDKQEFAALCSAGHPSRE